MVKLIPNWSPSFTNSASCVGLSRPSARVDPSSSMAMLVGREDCVETGSNFFQSTDNKDNELPSP